VTVDGHDVAALAEPAGEARDGRPLFVLARTDPARGVELFRERAPKLHYLRFTTDEEFLRYKQDYERLAKEYASWK